MSAPVGAGSGTVDMTQFYGNGTPAPAAAPRGPVEPGTALSPAPCQIKTFLKGKPKVLGYIISGSLSISAPTVRLIKAALGMNVVSTVAAVLGICNYSIDIVISSIQRYCYGYYDRFCWGYVNKETVLNIVPLILTLLEFCLAISVAAFGCKALCHDSCTPVVILHNSFSPAEVRGQNPYSETKDAPPAYTE
ncbi:membrane-spanning 4-domains subfamily A member 4A-like isoform X2 [Polyodon spathula]|uniref:membrane-spanning 4-domains subfamily A member 4A-like isoform X2 n=1 Tax=Polyodon spathula TaxID=7913 RepID=UPI001B7D9CA6|nr:membrane-spanning 4-domains subfamily A member 4A-like isoform X2 [Polyodon spathula]